MDEDHGNERFGWPFDRKCPFFCLFRSRATTRVDLLCLPAIIVSTALSTASECLRLRPERLSSCTVPVCSKRLTQRSTNWKSKPVLRTISAGFNPSLCQVTTSHLSASERCTILNSKKESYKSMFSDFWKVKTRKAGVFLSFYGIHQGHSRNIHKK